MKLSGLDLSPPASAAYSWITLGKYFSHCLSLPICKIEIVKYLFHGVAVRIMVVYVCCGKDFAQRKHYKMLIFISGSSICIEQHLFSAR